MRWAGLIIFLLIDLGKNVCELRYEKWYSMIWFERRALFKGNARMGDPEYIGKGKTEAAR